MEKVFEALEYIFNEALFSEFKEETHTKVRECHSIVNQALTELQAIKETKPSEALIFINSLLNARLSDKHFINVANDETWLELVNIKQALIKAEKLKKENKFLKDALNVLIKIDDSDISHLKIKAIPQNVAANQDVIKLLKDMLE